MTEILMLCTANVCRSVMAQALLTRRLIDTGAITSVSSAGILQGGQPSAPGAASALALLGLDVRSHRSRRVDAADLSAADVVLTMAREQLRYAVVTAPDAWSRTFTLKELIRRGQVIGSRRPGQPLADWLALAHHGRNQSGLLGDDPADDVADPIGGPPEAFVATAVQLDYLLGQLVDLAWASG